MTGVLSSRYFQEAKKVIPGGVNSPVRACKSVGADPVFFSHGTGPFLIDVEGKEYIDYVASWGPLILGHAHPEIVSAVQGAAEGGTSFGAPTWQEVELARMICDLIPSMEMVRLVNSGTEATMSAIRLARGYTKRKKIIKFDGCYHGHADSFLVKAGSGVATLGIPGSPGVPDEIVAHTISLPFNDIEAVKEVFENMSEEIAAVIVEPIAGNMGVVPPKPGFLEELRRLTLKNRSLLIFDEVITGFRVGLSGAQGLYGISPDLTCLGKIIGGGLPVGAYGGQEEIMSHIAPEGPVYQAGTLSGNPIAVAAGLATLRVLTRPGVYERLEELSQRLETGFLEAAQSIGMEVSCQRVGSMMTCFFKKGGVANFSETLQANTELYGSFWRAMLERGVYLAPSQFEATFVSLAHTEEEIDYTVEAVRDTFKLLKTKF